MESAAVRLVEVVSVAVGPVTTVESVIMMLVKVLLVAVGRAVP
jgi:hypothetical protein